MPRAGGGMEIEMTKENTLNLDCYDFPIMICSGAGQIIYKNKSLRDVPDFRRKTDIRSVLDDYDYEKFLGTTNYGTDNAVSRQLFNVRVRRQQMCHIAYVSKSGEAARGVGEAGGSTIWMFFRMLQFLPPDMLERYSPYGFSGCLRYITDTAIECAENGTRSEMFDERKGVNRDVIISKLDHMVKYILKFRKSITRDFDRFDLNDGINILKFITDVYLKSSPVSIAFSDKASQKLSNFSVRPGHIDNFERYSTLYASMLYAAATISGIASTTVTLDISDDTISADTRCKLFNPGPVSVKKTKDVFNSALLYSGLNNSGYKLIMEKDGQTVRCSLSENITQYKPSDILSVKRPSIFKACDAELALAIAMFIDVFGTIMF